MTYRAIVDWTLPEGQDFFTGRYSRGHSVTFGSGQGLMGTASPHVIGNKWSVAGAVDPEEMLVASVSACHMLTFLHVAREAGFSIEAYRDDAEGVMAPNGEGRTAVTRVVLRPVITYVGRVPDAEEAQRLHHAAHEGCFIANSLKTEVVIEI